MVRVSGQLFFIRDVPFAVHGAQTPRASHMVQVFYMIVVSAEISMNVFLQIAWQLPGGGKELK